MYTKALQEEGMQSTLCDSRWKLEERAVKEEADSDEIPGRKQINTP